MYFALPGTFTVSQIASGAYDAVWYNPRTTATDVTTCLTFPGAVTTNTTGAGEDWVLWLKKRATAC